MGFIDKQLAALSSKLNARHVKSRRAGNAQILFYIEGWHAIAEANRIFGFDAWDRQTLSTECVWQGAAPQRQHACSYVARVRVTVRAGGVVVCREASGSGHGIGATPGAAHESAIKEAETDAMKRALITFGNSFGLALYDPELRGVRGGARRKPNRHAVSWVILAPDGRVLATYPDPLDFCTALRHHLEEVADPRALKALWARHAAALEMLRCNFPDLRSDRGIHWVEVLHACYSRRREVVNELAGTQQASASASQPSDYSGGHSVPATLEPRRVRDKEHLHFVASLPCLVCGRTPSQPHHIRFAQPRAMGSKPGDQWVVPLCRMHHRALHDAGNERVWWQDAKIDPLAEAERLWAGRSGSTAAARLTRASPS
jgi:DNA recombination protein Rad52